MTPEEISRWQAKAGMLQAEMHEIIEFIMKKEGAKFNYQDAVNAYFLFKLAQLSEKKANQQE